ncbi:MAG: hypothetical protein U1F43_12700 [Myxococcota bacterium]
MSRTVVVAALACLVPSLALAAPAPGPVTLAREVVHVKGDGGDVTLEYPVVTAAPGTKALDALNQALSLDNALKESLSGLEAQAKEGSVTGLTYTVGYNGHGVLDLTFDLATMGAYPDVQVTHVLLDTRSGKVIHAADCFDAGKLEQLATAVDTDFRAAIDKLFAESGADLDGIADGLRDMHFGPTNLDSFEVTAQGVVFTFDFDFPHVALALEPDGRFPMSWAEIAPFLKADAPIAAVAPERPVR